MADPRRRTPRTDTVLDAPDVRAACTRLGSGAGQGDRRRGAGGLPRRDGSSPTTWCRSCSPACPRRPPRCAGSSTPRASWCTPTSVARRSPPPRWRRSPSRPAPRTSSSTSPPAAAGRGGLRRWPPWPRPCRTPAGSTWSTTEPPRSPSSPARSAFGREVVVARGELVEIGDGFRIPELVESVGAPAARGGHDQPGAAGGLPRRGRRADRVRAQGAPLELPGGGLHLHGRRSPSSPALGVPVVADIGSGLLAPHPRLPDEPDAGVAPRAPAPPWSRPPATSCSAARSAGCCSATPSSCSGCGGIPFARALRVDKLTLAALEATLTGPATAGRGGAGRPPGGPARPRASGWRRRSATPGAAAVASTGRRRRRRRARRGAAQRRRRPARPAGRRAAARAPAGGRPRRRRAAAARPDRGARRSRRRRRGRGRATALARTR